MNRKLAALMSLCALLKFTPMPVYADESAAPVKDNGSIAPASTTSSGKATKLDLCKGADHVKHFSSSYHIDPLHLSLVPLSAPLLLWCANQAQRLAS